MAGTSQPVERPRGDGPLRIGYVGSVVWHKGLHVLLAAARELKGNFQLSIHGDLNVDPGYVRELRATAAPLAVRFEGAFDREAVGRIYASLDVLVVPSIWPENAPLVLQEARQHGVALVASAIGGLPEFIRDGVDGRLFAPDRADQLQQVLQDLIDDPSRAARLAAVPVSIKAIDVDAAEWERRYAWLTHLDPDSDVERRAPVAGVAGRD